MKKMTKAMLMTALILGSVQFASAPVHASELDTFTLDEYVVTATRTETKLVDTPANITIVGAEEIESRHYTSVVEVMKDVPGVNVLDNGTGTSTQNVYLNGDERVLVMVDGRRVNFDAGTGSGASGFDLNQLPNPELIERIEILKGAGGALYGSDAVGGVINVITKKGAQSYGKVSVGFGSNGAEDLSAMYYAKAGKTGVSVSASKYKQDYYKYRDYATDTTKRWPDASDFEEEKVSLRIDQEVKEGSNLAVGYDYSKYEGMSPYSISNIVDDSWEDYSSAFVKRETQNIYAKYDWTLNEKDQGYLQVYHNELDYLNGTPIKERTDGIDLQQAITLHDTNKIVVGTSWREADVESVSGTYDDGIDNVSFFINDTWEFIPTWTLNVGARYDDHSHAGDDTTFSTGLNKKINDDSHIYVNWSEVFRAPNTDDLFTKSEGSYPSYGDENLKPETGETWTVGYTTKINDKTDVGINYFESDLEDAIDWISNDWVHYYAKNINKQEKKGMELTLKHKLNNNVNLNASYTYISVKNDEGDGAGFKKDYNYMPNVYRLGLNYHDGKWDTNLWLRAGRGGNTPEYNGGYGKNYLDSSYLTVDATVTYKADKNLKVFAKAYNLFNEAYCESAGVYNWSYDKPAQSRRFLIGAEYSF